MKNWIAILLYIILLAGCGVNVDTSPTKTETNFKVETQTASTVVSLSTPTPSVTIEPTATRMLLPTSTIEARRQCVDVTTSEISFPSTNVGGNLSLISSLHKSQGSFLLNLVTNERTSLPNSGYEYISDGFLSPNGAWLAYRVFDQSLQHKLLLIVSSTGEVKKEINLVNQVQLKSTTIVSWIDEERLVVVQTGESSPAESIAILLNPFTGKLSQYKSDYKNLYTLYPQFMYLWGDNFRTLSVYHPSLKWVIYKSFDGVVLWDLTNKQVVKLLPDVGGPRSSGSVWSPDGARFVIDLDSPTGRNLFLVSTTGELEQVTFFEERKPGDLMDFTWSPDGKSIAFWFSTRKGLIDAPNEPLYDLAIMNLDTHEVNILCVPPYIFGKRYPDYPIWSPDGKWLAVAAEKEGDPQRSTAILVDLSSGHSYRIADDVIPAGWMENP